MFDLWRYRHMISQLLWREIQQQYRGTAFGFFWAVVAPFLDLLVYSFVFVVLFHAPTPAPPGVKVVLPYSLVLLAGLFPYNILSQVVGMAPQEVLRHPNFVKKVRFPLEVLPVVRLGVALFHGGVAFAVLLGGVLWYTHRLPWTIVLLPIALMPLVALAVGLGWFLSSLGVYIRDLQSVAAVVLRVWFFATPIVYPITRLPAWAVPLVQWNPLTFVVEAVRAVLLWGTGFPWGVWVLWMAFTGGLAFAGYKWFIHTKQGFADVL